MPAADWKPTPPHDCRITARCFRSAFGFTLRPPYDFGVFREQNTGIEKFFDYRENDEAGGEGGERISQVKERSVFSLHVAKMRGATWFDRSRPPQGIVWLCGYEPHDERFKGRDDAYDRFARAERDGNFYPEEVDYKALDLSRRTRDANWVSSLAIDECEALLRTAIEDGAAQGAVRGIAIRLRRTLDDPTFIVVAVSKRPVRGTLFGDLIELTNERFYLVAAAMKAGGARLASDSPEIDIPVHEFPGGLNDERAFEVALQLS